MVAVEVHTQLEFAGGTGAGGATGGVASASAVAMAANAITLAIQRVAPTHCYSVLPGVTWGFAGIGQLIPANPETPCKLFERPRM